LLNVLDTEAQILSDEEDELMEHVVTGDGTIDLAVFEDEPTDEDEPWEADDEADR
jgi:hypothetical protein